MMNCVSAVGIAIAIAILTVLQYDPPTADAFVGGCSRARRTLPSSSCSSSLVSSSSNLRYRRNRYLYMTIPKDEDDDLETLQRQTKQALEAAKKAIQDADAKVAAQQQQTAQSLQQASDKVEQSLGTMKTTTKNETTNQELLLTTAKQAMADVYETAAAQQINASTTSSSRSRNVSALDDDKVDDVSTGPSQNNTASLEAAKQAIANVYIKAVEDDIQLPSPSSSSSSWMMDRNDENDNKVQEATVEAVKSLGTTLGRLTAALVKIALLQIQRTPKVLAVQAERAVESVGTAITNYAQTTVDRALDVITSIPNNVVVAANTRAQDTVDYVTNIPDRLFTAMERKAQQTVDELTSLPDKVASTIQVKSREAVNEIVQLPNKLSDNALQKARSTVEEIQQLPITVVKNVAQLPAQVAEVAERKRIETTAELQLLPERLAYATKVGATQVAQEIETLPTNLVVFAKTATSTALQDIRAVPSKMLPKPKDPERQLLEAEEQQRKALERVRQKIEEAKVAAAQVEEAKRYTLAQKRKEQEFQQRQHAARAKEAQRSAEMKTQANPRMTFSLTSLFGTGLEPKDDTTDDISASETIRPPAQPRMLATPPFGTPVMSDWKQNRDGSITGRITRGLSFTDGERITTSPVGGKAIGGALVQSSTGSRYYLEDPEKTTLAAKDKKRQKENEARRKGAAAAEAKRKAAMKKSASYDSAKRTVEDEKRRKAAAAAAKRALLEEKRRANEERTKAAEQKRRDVEKKRQEAAAEAEAKRKQAAEVKARAALATRARDSIQRAKASSTFSLSSVLGSETELVGSQAQDAQKANKPSVSISLFGLGGETEQNNGKSTSAIKGGTDARRTNTVKATKPRASIFLFGLREETEQSNGKTSRAVRATTRVSRKMEAKKRKAEKKRPAGARAAKKIVDSPSKAEKPSITISLFGLAGEPKQSNGSASTAVSERRERKLMGKKRAAFASAKQVKKDEATDKPSATISLFGLGEQSKQKNGVAESISATAPRGVPTIVQWKRQKDGGIKGFIYGSPNFDDGKQVVTSPIVSGTVSNGSVVRTGSGSYFLSSDKKT